MRNERSTVCLLVLALSLCACSGNEDASNSTVPEAPDTVVDMGPEPDVSPEPLGELCHVKVGVSSDTAFARPGISITDLTTGEPIPELDRSGPGNHYFDAQLGHEVEFEIGAAAGVPVAPLTYSATVDQRCQSLGDLEFYTPVGLTVEQIPDPDTTPDDLAPVFAAMGEGALFVRGLEGWNVVQTLDDPFFDVGLGDGDEFFGNLPADARFHSISNGRILAESSTEVGLLSLETRGVVSSGIQSMATPLRKLVVVDDSRVLVHDGDGKIWGFRFGDATPTWTEVVEETFVSVWASDDALWLLDEVGTVSRLDHSASSPELVGTIDGGPSRLFVNASGTRILAGFGSCEDWFGRCQVTLYDAQLNQVLSADAPISTSQVRAATNVGDDFVLAVEDGAGARVVHIESDVLTDGASLPGTIDPTLSVVLPNALAINTVVRTTFARRSDSQAAFDDGWWTVLPRNDGLIELVETPCDDPLTCERKLWADDFSNRMSVPGTTLQLGRDRDIIPLNNSDAYQQLDFQRGDDIASTLFSITLEPLLVPMGAPCLPVLDTTVAVERFTSARKALHCVTWWRT